MPIETPCTKVCVLDPARRLCVGCGRNLDEIARWSAMSEDERARVLRQLPQRLRRLGAPPARAVGPA
jgi:predicted Fe-S protein YdhL (DUF1289 family)